MDDKEVGELWERYRKYPSLRGAEGLRLIRKLVEERRLTHKLNNLLSNDREITEDEALNGALNQFGIDPREWK